MSFPYFKPNGKLLFNTDGTLTAHENCCCTLYCDDCCTGDLTGYEITISGVANEDGSICDCGDINGTWCIPSGTPSVPDTCGGSVRVGDCIAGAYVAYEVISGPGTKCTLRVSVHDPGLSSALPSDHAATGELEFDAGDPCRDVSGAMTMTITPPTTLFGEPIPTFCDLDGTQITVNEVCSE